MTDTSTHSSPAEQRRDERINRDIAEAIRQSRNNALDAAIELCEDFARSGHDAACCVRALRDFRESVNAITPVPSKGN